MHVTRDVTRRIPPPAFFCQTDPVLAGNYATPCQHLCKKIVQRVFDFFANGRVAIVAVRHDIDVNVAVARMTKAFRSLLRRWQSATHLPSVSQAAYEWLRTRCGRFPLAHPDPRADARSPRAQSSCRGRVALLPA